MTTRFLPLSLFALLTAACEIGGGRPAWRPDPSLPPTASLTVRVSAHFETTPVTNEDPTRAGPPLE